MRRKEPYGTARVVQHFQLTELRPSIHPSAHSTLVVLPLLLLRYILYFLRRGRWREKTFVRFWLDGYRSSSRRSSSGGSILNQRSPVFLFQSFHFPRCSVPMPVGRKRMEGGKKISGNVHYRKMLLAFIYVRYSRFTFPTTWSPHYLAKRYVSTLVYSVITNATQIYSAFLIFPKWLFFLISLVRTRGFYIRIFPYDMCFQ